MSAESTTETPSLTDKQRKIDSTLNKTFLDIAVFSAIGWSAGILAGLFFKKAAPVRYVWSGVGGSYGLVLNRFNLKEFA